MYEATRFRAASRYVGTPGGRAETFSRGRPSCSSSVWSVSSSMLYLTAYGYACENGRLKGRIERTLAMRKWSAETMPCVVATSGSAPFGVVNRMALA